MLAPETAKAFALPCLFRRIHLAALTSDLHSAIFSHASFICISA